jgi:hypothetical protein
MSRSPLTRIHMGPKAVSASERARAAGLFRAPHSANDNYKQGGTRGLLGEFLGAVRKARDLAGYIGIFERVSRMLKQRRKRAAPDSLDANRR